MNLKKIIQYGFIASCLLSSTIATDDMHDDNLDKVIKTFKCPTIDELHIHAKKLKESPSWRAYASTSFILKTNEGAIFKTALDPWDNNKEVVQRVLNLDRYDYSCVVKKDGLIKQILFRYSPKEAASLTLRVNLEKMKIDPINISFSVSDSDMKISYSTDGTEYITFEDPNLIFTFQQ